MVEIKEIDLNNREIIGEYEDSSLGIDLLVKVVGAIEESVFGGDKSNVEDYSRFNWIDKSTGERKPFTRKVKVYK